MMTREKAIEIMKMQGNIDALDLQSRSPSMTETEIINEEEKIPRFNPKKDYSSWKPGYPVIDEEQVWILITPHNASYYEGTPSTLRSLWGLAHTTNPEKAKEWIAPYGTSGLYMKNECCIDSNADNNGIVYRSIVDNNAYAPSDYMANWEVVD